MSKLTRFYQEIRIAYLRSLTVIMLLAFIFFPSFQPIVKGGNNMFTLYLNGTFVGVAKDDSEAEEFLRLARLKCADERDDIMMVDAVVKSEGKECLWGVIDSEQTIVGNMCNVLNDNAIETTKRAYTIKIKDYMINLSDAGQVQELLQAALDKYQQNGQFQVELVLDQTRELNVLTTQVKTKDEIEDTSFYMPQAGVASQLTEMTQNIESAAEKDFDDYEYGLVNLEYGDKVEVVESYLPQAFLTDLQTAIAQVTQDQEVNTIYEVAAGDTLSEIAINTNVPLDKIIELNENLEDENSTIRVGDELIITMPEPKLSIERQEEVYYEEDYEAEVEYVYNDDWYTTDSQVLQAPSAGHRNVAALVSYRNDKTTNTEILKEEITYAAVPKIVEKGTKIPPTYMKPISGGRLSSRFGRRSAPTRGASTYHKGIDWATPVGTAVCASSAGTVSRAGWGSGYGYVVYIEHADGRQTRYGHLSKILVKPGQTVAQGQKIALSGNTGRSTGPHLHFELLINGSQVNPLDYLN